MSIWIIAKTEVVKTVAIGSVKRYTAVQTIFEITINDKYTLLDDAY